MNNGARILVAHSFKDSAWDDPRWSSGRYVHMDLSREPDNEQWNEISMLDWLKDRPGALDGAEYVGTAQYRRFLVEKDIGEGQALVHYETTPRALDLDWNERHSAAYLSDFIARTRRSDPAFADGFEKWMSETTRRPARNLFLLPRRKFEEWASFVNKTRRRLAGMRRLDYGFRGKGVWEDRYQRRQPCFLLERLTGYWLEKISGLELVDADVVETGEYSPYQPRRKSCVVAIQRDEPNLDEWARWHLDVCGFDAVFLFNDECPPRAFPPDLESRVFQAPALGDGVNSGRQITCYNGWLYCQEAEEYDIAAFVDADEYVNLHGMKIEEFMWRRRAPVVGLNWVMFGSRILGEWPSSSMAKRFRHRARRPNGHLKPILSLDLLRAAEGLQFYFSIPHCLCARDAAGRFAVVPSLCEGGRTAEGPFLSADFDPAETPYVAHYYAKTEEEFRKKIERGRADAPRSSDQQFFRIEDRMWQIRRECDLSEVYDDELARRLW